MLHRALKFSKWVVRFLRHCVGVCSWLDDSEECDWKFKKKKQQRNDHKQPERHRCSLIDERMTHVTLAKQAVRPVVGPPHYVSAPDLDFLMHKVVSEWRALRL